MKTVVRRLSEHRTLFRDTENGIAWIEDTSVGLGYSCHPNISDTGSVTGMRLRGYWGEKDRVVSSHGFIFNVDKVAIYGDLDQIAADACECVACRERKMRNA